MNNPYLAALLCLGRRFTGLCAVTALTGIMILMVIDVTGRYVFNQPVPGAAELIELAMGIMVFAALPMTTLRREHISLDYAESLFGRAIRPYLRGLVDIVTALIIGFLGWRLAMKAATILRYSDTTPYLQISIAPVAIFVSVMTLITAVVLLVSVVLPSREKAGSAA